MDVVWKKQGRGGQQHCQMPIARGSDRGGRDRERENMESKGERGDEAG